MTGIEAIAAERQRQIDQEGWTPAHDDSHGTGEMAKAAACYAMPGYGKFVSQHWPWDWSWFKPSLENRKRELEKAGALIAAEWDRLDRAEKVSKALEEAGQ